MDMHDSDHDAREGRDGHTPDEPREGDYLCTYIDCNEEFGAWLVETVEGGDCLLFDDDEEALATALTQVQWGVRQAAAEGRDLRAYVVPRFSVTPVLIDPRKLELGLINSRDLDPELDF